MVLLWSPAVARPAAGWVVWAASKVLASDLLQGRGTRVRQPDVEADLTSDLRAVAQAGRVTLLKSLLLQAASQPATPRGHHRVRTAALRMAAACPPSSATGASRTSPALGIIKSLERRRHAQGPEFSATPCRKVCDAPSKLLFLFGSVCSRLLHCCDVIRLEDAVLRQ